MTLRQDQQQPLTRRQLREMERASQEATTGEQQVPAVELPFSAAVPATPAPVPADLRPVLSTDAPPPAPVVPLTRRQLRALQQAEEIQSAPVEDVEQPQQPAAPASAPIAAVPVAALPIAALPLPQPPVIAAAPEPEIPAAFTAATPEVIDDVPVGLTTGEVRAYQPPTGHWSLGANESFDDVIASGVTDAHIRSVESSGATTASNALIIPIVPSAVDMTGPLNATGEILLTGSIDLPRGLGSTGQVQGHFDGSDIDRLLDQHDRDLAPNSSVEPVAATRAIATHAPSASPNIVPPKKTSHKVGAIIGVSAGGVAALGVIGAVIAGFVFHVF
ncbi:hypothetical protein [Gryllotalpicola protaetiae]|uniref:Uncharacterized protein n=1 Tax=Gryllotalpicola protaetiae TaxID=2419771 RepID=A0A387BWA6_9MICO|nr:hypothetical protein [Gryllotalpicola protaetiae]AYG05117.1 hypothetical protein D7I44_17435 [Gryllotalpicola protaetiae]